MTEREIKILAAKFLNGTASKKEEDLLHSWYDNQKLNKSQLTVLTKGESKEDVKRRLYNSIVSALSEEVKIENKKRPRAWKWIPYAAIFLMFLSIGIYVLKDLSDEEIHYTQVLKNDVTSGGESAILELESGKKINLDSTQVGEISGLNGISVNRTVDGGLSLDISAVATTSAIQQNTIRTPKGGHFHIKLPDGTNVWLNASSSIKFPSVFSETLREVYLEGEAYFEVTKVSKGKSRQVPFAIRTKQQQINVLGTSFNVNSYPNESAEYTTLLEGSVHVLPTGARSRKILQPGEQSAVKNSMVSIQPADLEPAVAWKNGDFIFNQEKLQSIMKKIVRSYDVEVVHNGGYE